MTENIPALLGHINNKLLLMNLNAELTALLGQNLVYCAAVAVIRTLGRSAKS